MEIKSVKCAYFSPTGNVKKIVLTLGKELANAINAEFYSDDFTLDSQRMETRRFKTVDILIVGVPVYAGRVPNKLLSSLENLFSGDNTLAVPIVAFGNRNYDNGLIELRNILEASGFHTIAGGAFPTEHVFSDKIATGRPNDADLNLVKEFALQIANKISGMEEAPMSPIFVKGDDIVDKYYTPLGVDGKPAVFLKAKPKTKETLCNNCGLCAKVCPVGSIDIQNPSVINGICIKCQACIKKCSQKAKYFDDQAFLSHVKMLEKNYTDRKEAETFI